MNAQELWQSQALDAPRISLAYVRHRAHDFKRRTQIRNFSEYMGAVLSLPIFVFAASEHRNRPLMLLGIACIFLAGIYIIYRWYRLASAADLSTDTVVNNTLRCYRRELERQRDARQGNWRWWLPPMVPGLLLMLASSIFEVEPVPWPYVALSAAVLFLSPVLGVMFYEWSARRLQREIDALDSLAGKNDQH